MYCVYVGIGQIFINVKNGVIFKKNTVMFLIIFAIVTLVIFKHFDISLIETVSCTDKEFPQFNKMDPVQVKAPLLNHEERVQRVQDILNTREFTRIQRERLHTFFQQNVQQPVNNAGNDVVVYGNAGHVPENINAEHNDGASFIRILIIVGVTIAALLFIYKFFNEFKDLFLNLSASMTRSLLLHQFDLIRNNPQLVENLYNILTEPENMPPSTF